MSLNAVYATSGTDVLNPLYTTVGFIANTKISSQLTSSTVGFPTRPFLQISAPWNTPFLPAQPSNIPTATVNVAAPLVRLVLTFNSSIY
jgi:hypothetical protein